MIFCNAKSIKRVTEGSWQGREKICPEYTQTPYLQEKQTFWARIIMVLVGIKAHDACLSKFQSHPLPLTGH